MISADEWLAEPRYDQVIVTAPNDIDKEWRCTVSVGSDKYTGFGLNGFMALSAAIRRMRTTDTDTGPITLTIDADRGHLQEGKHRLDYLE